MTERRPQRPPRTPGRAPSAAWSPHAQKKNRRPAVGHVRVSPWVGEPPGYSAVALDASTTAVTSGRMRLPRGSTVSASILIRSRRSRRASRAHAWAMSTAPSAGAWDRWRDRTRSVRATNRRPSTWNGSLGAPLTRGYSYPIGCVRGPAARLNRALGDQTSVGASARVGLTGDGHGLDGPRRLVPPFTRLRPTRPAQDRV